MLDIIHTARPTAADGWGRTFLIRAFLSPSWLSGPFSGETGCLVLRVVSFWQHIGGYRLPEAPDNLE